MTAVFVGLGLLAAACGGGAATNTAGQASSSPSEGDGQVQFSAGELGGGEFNSSSLAGKDTVLWFWAPWCTVCRAEAPDVVAAAESFDGQVEVIGIAGRGEIPEMEDFVSDTGTDGLRHVVDESGSIWSSFGVFAQPAYAFVSDSGEIEVFVGALGEEALSERMSALAEA